MKWIDQLEKRWRGWGIERLTEGLLIGQIVGFVLVTLRPEMVERMSLVGGAVLSGEYWRLLTWLLIPVSTSPIWAVFAWYLYYIYGRSLAATWGDFRYTLYWGLLLLGSWGGALVYPVVVVDNYFLFAALFYAFAYLYPDFELRLFFFLQVKVKWLAGLGWIGMGWTLVSGTGVDRFMIGVVVLVFGLFFGGELWYQIKTYGKGTKRSVKRVREVGTSYMICVVCGANERSRKIFYYCDECEPQTCFCEDHIEGHVHVGE